MANYIGNFKDKNNNVLYSPMPKSAIMVFINKTITITTSLAWGQYHLPFNAIYKNIGTAFTLSNTTTGAIQYNGNSNAVKITMHISRSGDTTAGNVYPTCSALSQYYQEFANADRPYATVTVIQPVSKGDYITPYIRPSSTGNVVLTGDASSPYTYMIVEEL